MNADVVVVGSGGAGLAADLAASLAGASVAILERASVFGGTTAISGGGWAPDREAFASGLDFSKPGMSSREVSLLEDWYDRNVGEVPRASSAS